MVRFSRMAVRGLPLTVGALLLTTRVSAAQSSTVDAATVRTDGRHQRAAEHQEDA
jgi:hypothetical protein